MNVEHDLNLLLPTTKPEIRNIVSKKQHQRSH
jgi:hypothetical protein